MASLPAGSRPAPAIFFSPSSSTPGPCTLRGRPRLQHFPPDVASGQQAVLHFYLLSPTPSRLRQVASWSSHLRRLANLSSGLHVPACPAFENVSSTLHLCNILAAPALLSRMSLFPMTVPSAPWLLSSSLSLHPGSCNLMDYSQSPCD